MIQPGFGSLKIGKTQINFGRYGFGFERHDSRGPWRQFKWTMSMWVIQVMRWR
jgi:hypothetical protein